MPKAKKKKVNPNRQPASQADVQRETQKAIDLAVIQTTAICLSSVRDVFGFGKLRMQRLWRLIENRSDDVYNGKQRIEDFLQTLEDECGIRIVK